MHISRKHYRDSLYSKIIGHFLVVGIFTGSAGMVPSESDVFRGHFLTLVLDLALAKKLGNLIYFNFLKHSIFDYSDTSVILVCICSNKILFVHCKRCFCCCWRLRKRFWSGLPGVVQKQQSLPSSVGSVPPVCPSSRELPRGPGPGAAALCGEAEATGPA